MEEKDWNDLSVICNRFLTIQKETSDYLQKKLGSSYSVKESTFEDFTSYDFEIEDNDLEISYCLYLEFKNPERKGYVFLGFSNIPDASRDIFLAECDYFFKDEINDIDENIKFLLDKVISHIISFRKNKTMVNQNGKKVNFRPYIPF